MNENITELAQSVERIKEDLPSEYYYTCLPLCLIDAIFSIGATYKSTQNAVTFFAQRYNIHMDRRTGKSGFTINDMLDKYDEYIDKDYEEISKILFNNKQMTSTKNGIRKAEAIKQCAMVLKKYGIQTIDDFQKKMSTVVEAEYKKVPGQSSGISLIYLKMLCGDDTLVKPDRHILRFLGGDYDNPYDRNQAQKIIEKIVEQLKTTYPNITARKVDYIIWNYMKDRK